MQMDTNTIGLPPINHLGIVVKGVDRTAEFLSKLFGIGSWEIFDYEAVEDEMPETRPSSCFYLIAASESSK